MCSWCIPEIDFLLVLKKIRVKPLSAWAGTWAHASPAPCLFQPSQSI